METDEAVAGDPVDCPERGVCGSVACLCGGSRMESHGEALRTGQQRYGVVSASPRVERHCRTVAEIEPRLREFRASADEICRQISQLRMEIIDQLAAPNPDLAAIKAKQEEILAGQRRMQGLVIEQLTGEKAVLTAEQQQRLFDMLRSRSGCDRGGPMLVPGRGHEGGIGQTLRTGGTD